MNYKLSKKKEHEKMMSWPDYNFKQNSVPAIARSGSCF